MTRLAAVLTTALLLAGCGAAPTRVPSAARTGAGQVAARDFSFDRMEEEYSYKLGNKAAKAFLEAAEKAAEPYKKNKTTCELKAKSGFFGTTIQVNLAGTIANVSELHKALDALFKAHK